MTNKNSAKTALVTGGTSGIGHHIAHNFAKDGYNLILVARDEGELSDCADHFRKKHGVEVMTIAKDLMDPQAAEEVYNEVKATGIRVDALVNDAGQGVYGEFATTDLQREMDIIQLNIISLTVLTKLYLKEMVARKDGKILQVASMVGIAPSPLMAVYAGTKAYVYNFTQSIINELKDSGVTVTALLPGATDTDFFNKADAENIKIVQDGDLADPADVAKDGYDALMKGESKVVSGLKNKVMAAMTNIMPEQMVADSMHKQNEEVGNKKK